mgnify:FL=1
MLTTHGLENKIQLKDNKILWLAIKTKSKVRTTSFKATTMWLEIYHLKKWRNCKTKWWIAWNPDSQVCLKPLMWNPVSQLRCHCLRKNQHLIKILHHWILKNWHQKYRKMINHLKRQILLFPRAKQFWIPLKKRNHQKLINRAMNNQNKQNKQNKQNRNRKFLKVSID